MQALDDDLNAGLVAQLVGPALRLGDTDDAVEIVLDEFAEGPTIPRLTCSVSCVFALLPTIVPEAKSQPA